MLPIRPSLVLWFLEAAEWPGSLTPLPARGIEPVTSASGRAEGTGTYSGNTRSGNVNAEASPLAKDATIKAATTTVERREVEMLRVIGISYLLQRQPRCRDEENVLVRRPP